MNFNIFPAGLGAFGDDNGTETVEGFTAGQPFAFRLYDASIDAEFNATVIFVEGQQSWLNGGFTVVRLSAQSEAAPEIDLSAVSHEFGEVFVGALRNWAFDIQNIGGATLTIYSVTSNDNDVFSTDFSGETSIDPNSALTVDVTFGPDAAGDFSGTLTIVSNDGNESEVTVSLTGTGTEERIPDIAVAPESLAFGNIAIGRNSTQTVTISNNGTGDLTLTAVTLSGEGFSMTDNGESNVITPGNSQDIDITFTPTQVQEYQGNLTIESDDADEGEIVVNLSGAGVLARHFEFGQTNTNHSILINSALIDNGQLVAGDEIGVFTPGGACAGGVILIDSEDGIYPAGLAAFGADGGTPGFTSGQAFAFKMFDASADLEIDAEIEYSEGPHAWINGGLTIIGRLFAYTQARPVIQLSENVHDFGEVGIGETADWVVTILNVGNADLSITSVSIDNEAFWSDFGNAVEISPDESVVLNVYFTPPDAGDFSATLVIASNDPDNGEVECQLSGVGSSVIVPEIDYSDLNHDFGEVPVGRSDNWTLTISNVGTGNLTITDISTNLGVFTTNFANFDGSLIIAARETADIIFVFTPEEITDYSGVFTITSDDEDEGSLEGGLYGRGGQPGPHFNFAQTGGNHSLLISGATIDGQSLVEGDEIGVFTPDGFCAGGYVLTPLEGGALYPAGLAAWGDDQNQAGRQGFFPNEDFAFKIWDLSAQEEISAFPNYLEGPQRFVGDGFTILRLVAEHEARPDIAISPDAIDFGGVIVGETSNRSFFITNMGTAQLNVTSISCPEGVFTPGSTGGFSLAPGQRIEIAAVFQPTEAIDYNEELTIESDDPDESTVVINLSGSGLAQPPADIAVSNTAHDFGEIALGNTATWEIDISNEGFLPLVVSNIASDDGAFSTDFNGEINIASGESASINVFFAPTEARGYNSTLHIASNDPDENPVEISLSGSGISEGAPDIDVAARDNSDWEVELYSASTREFIIANVGNDMLNVQGAELQNGDFSASFGALQINPGSSEVFNVTFRPSDLGERTAQFTIISDDPDESEFVLNIVGIGIPAGPHFDFTTSGENHSLLVNAATLDGELLVQGDEIAVFTPSGVCAGAIILASEDGEIYPAGFPAWGDDREREGIQGFLANEAFSFKFWDISAQEEIVAFPNYEDGPEVWGVNNITSLSLIAEHETRPQIALSTDQIDFGGVIIFEAAQGEVTISNRGTATLTVNQLALSGEGFSMDAENGFELAPSESYIVSFGFRPEEEREYNGSLEITSNDPNNQTVSVSLVGTGLPQPPPDIDLSANEHNFGDISIGNVASWQFEITNRGYLPLNITAITLEEDAFTVPFEEGISIAQNETISFDVFFEPTSERDYAGTLSIYSNDIDENPVTVTLSGTGVTEGEPDITLSQNSNDFGSVEAYDTAVWSLRISNDGNDRLTVNNVFIEDVGFSVDWQGETVVNPGSGVDINVFFSPTEVRDYYWGSNYHLERP